MRAHVGSHHPGFTFSVSKVCRVQLDNAICETFLVSPPQSGRPIQVPKFQTLPVCSQHIHRLGGLRRLWRTSDFMHLDQTPHALTQFFHIVDVVHVVSLAQVEREATVAAGLLENSARGNRPKREQKSQVLAGGQTSTAIGPGKERGSALSARAARPERRPRLRRHLEPASERLGGGEPFARWQEE